MPNSMKRDLGSNCADTNARCIQPSQWVSRYGHSIAKSEFGPIRNVKDSSGWIAGPRPEGALIDSAFAQLASHCRKAHAAHDHEKTEELKRLPSRRKTKKRTTVQAQR